MFPPVSVVAIAIELTTPIVEAVCDLVTDDVANGTVVQVIWTVLVEEDALQNASRELDLQEHSHGLRGVAGDRRHTGCLRCSPVSCKMHLSSLPGKTSSSCQFTIPITTLFSRFTRDSHSLVLVIRLPQLFDIVVRPVLAQRLHVGVEGGRLVQLQLRLIVKLQTFRCLASQRQ